MPVTWHTEIRSKILNYIFLEDVWQIIAVILLSSVKFGLGGVPLALGLYHFSFFKTVVTTSIGGILGIIVFGYLSDVILRYTKNFVKKWREKHPGKVRKKFTLKNKLIVKVKRRFGLVGLAILTPTLLSMPLGMLLAERYFHNKERVILYMITSVIFWSVAISSYKLFLN
jgi:hypothetical protein